MRTKSTGGFTLIELLIVIAIIGILAAVLIPNLMNARTTAAQRAAQAHSSTVYTAAMAALADNISATVDQIGGNCQTGGPITINGADTRYTVNPAPAGSTCSIGASATDVQVTVTHNATSTAYVNGVQQAAGGTTPPAEDGD